jgi:23S rRNA pseudouridine1911/1915/1917 synthase
MQLKAIIEENLSGQRLDRAASSIWVDYSRTSVKKWIDEGRVLLNGEVAKPKDKVFSGDEISMQPGVLREESWDPQDIPLNIIAQEQHFIVINKPSNLVVHPGAGISSGTLANALAFHFDELTALPRNGIVHRLDKDTSGIMVIARTPKFHKSIIAQLHDREVFKSYQAIVYGEVKASRNFNGDIGRDPKNRIKMKITEHGREAYTSIFPNLTKKGCSLIDVHIATGRTHQIRVHLSEGGLPIVGDQLYKPRSLNPNSFSPSVLEITSKFNRQALHAQQLKFLDPSGNNIDLAAEAPDDFLNLQEQLFL